MTNNKPIEIEDLFKNGFPELVDSIDYQIIANNELSDLPIFGNKVISRQSIGVKLTLTFKYKQWEHTIELMEGDPITREEIIEKVVKSLEGVVPFEELVAMRI